MMKRFILSTLFILSFSVIKAQSTSPVVSQSDSVYLQTDKAPEFVGGQKKLNRYLVKTLRYPAYAVEHNIQGTVVLQTIVEKDGSFSQLRIKTSASTDLDAEALRVIAQSPKWVPAQKDGKIVRAYHEIPVVFTLAN
ncbi:energy transducer TonB [Mucilaginibacter sp. PAMB04274]|uniref:energy transducer TonB n=1 Tax=Mucilaginibacter sp. PAMB04274 TaxID=3138568 RepID=UPI0031F66521